MNVFLTIVGREITGFPIGSENLFEIEIYQMKLLIDTPLS